MTVLLATVGLPLVVQGAGQKGEPIDKIEPVAVVGCLKELAPDTWTLVNASDPLPSSANAPSPKEMTTLPNGGKRQFELVGALAVFNLSAHRDHSVVVKGLPLKGATAGRLNVTSVTMVAAVCPAASTPK